MKIMKLLKQTGPYCLVYSAAMILDEDPEVLHKEIGTTGVEVWWKPNLLRGIHIQEIQDCCIRRGYCLYPVEQRPYLAPSEEHEPKPTLAEDIAMIRFRQAIFGRRAILITNNHAVAWDGYTVYDPKGFTESIKSYTVYEAWILTTDLIS